MENKSTKLLQDFFELKLRNCIEIDKKWLDKILCLRHTEGKRSTCTEQNSSFDHFPNQIQNYQFEEKTLVQSF